MRMRKNNLIIVGGCPGTAHFSPNQTHHGAMQMREKKSYKSVLLRTQSQRVRGLYDKAAQKSKDQ